MSVWTRLSACAVTFAAVGLVSGSAAAPTTARRLRDVDSGRGEASRAEVAAAHARADSLSAALEAVEARLGLREIRSPGREALRARYARLRDREIAVAKAASAWLRFVPASAPVDGGVVTSTFTAARYHPVKLRVLPHRGVDIAAPRGTPVRATADGRVYATADHPTAGLTVDVQHGASGFVTRYAHLSRIAVMPGKVVRRGDVIGWVGRTGLATGDHCHYEVFYRGWRTDPVDFLPPDSVAEEVMLGAD